MKYNRVKITYSKKGQELYFVGDGFWFGRVSKKEAEEKMASGKWYLWEDKRG